MDDLYQYKWACWAISILLFTFCGLSYGLHYSFVFSLFMAIATTCGILGWAICRAPQCGCRRR